MLEKQKPIKRNRHFTERRLEILRSASTVFTRNGFTGATMEEIAEKAEMAKGNLYYYFPSKQELLFFCQEYSLERLVEQAEEISHSDKTADAKLKCLINIHIRTVLEELPGSTAHTDFRSLPKDKLQIILKKRDKYERVYRRVVESGIKEGVFNVDNQKTAVWAMLGALNWVVQWYSPSGEMTPDRIAKDFGSLFVRSLSKN